MKEGFIYGCAASFVLGWLCCWLVGALRDTSAPRSRKREIPVARGTIKDGRLRISLEGFRANERDRVLRLPHHRGRR